MALWICARQTQGCNHKASMPELAGEYDVIVAGMGPAGSSAALHAARKGLSVLVLDKEKFPRDKVCGDALSSTSLASLDELGVLQDLTREPHTPVSEISYFTPGDVSVTVPLLKVEPGIPVTGMICRRIILDDLLARAVQQEATVMDWCTVQNVERLDDGRLCVTAELGGGRMHEFTCRAVVGADGVFSAVSRRLGVPRYTEYRALAARAYFRYVLGVTGRLEVHFLEDLLPGYVWIYPTESGLTNVGLSIPMYALKRKRINPRAILQHVISETRIAERFEFAERMGPVNVRVLPVGSTWRTVHGDNFILVGDAAGLVNPCSSEGVATALSSGKLAAEVLAEAFEREDFSHKSLSAYPYRLWKQLGPALKVAEHLLELRTPKAINSLVRSASRRPHNAGWISGILLGSALPSEELEQFLGYLNFFTK